MTLVELQKRINENIPIKVPILEGFGLDNKTVIIAGYGLKGTVTWTAENAEISTVRGLHTKANCIKAIPTNETSQVTAEDEAGNIVVFHLSYLI